MGDFGSTIPQTVRVKDPSSVRDAWIRVGCARPSVCHHTSPISSATQLAYGELNAAQKFCAPNGLKLEFAQGRIWHCGASLSETPQEALSGSDDPRHV